MQRKIIRVTGLGALLILFSAPAMSSIIFGENKIYFSGKNEFADVRVRNAGSESYLLASRMMSEETRYNMTRDGQEKSFMVTPPAVSLKGGGERILRITKSDTTHLPVTRESMHFLSVTSIPGGKASENSVQIAVRTWIRVIYRPEGLDTNKKMKFAFQKNNGEAVINNMSPFYLFISQLEINKVKIEEPRIIPPYKKINIGKCKSKCEVSYSFYKEDGSTGQTEKVAL